jgi:hypothetical protein
MKTDISNQSLAFTANLYHTNKGCKPVWQPDQFPATGVKHLHSEGRFRVGQHPTTNSPLLLSRRRYDQAIELLIAFITHAHSIKGNSRVAWVTEQEAPLVPNPAYLAARGIPLENLLMVETPHTQRTLQTLCCQNDVGAILVDAPATRATLQMARRWVKPPRQSDLLPADALPTLIAHKLVIFMD